MAEDDEEARTHEGYASGSAVLDLETATAAVRRLLAEVVEAKEKQPDGSVLVRRSHETDPPLDFLERRNMKRPGPLPDLLRVSEIPEKAKVEEHETNVLVEAGQDMDVTLYHFARWAVLEARRLRAKALAVRSAGPGDGPGWASVKVVFVL